MAKTSFLKIFIVVIRSVTPTFLFVSHLKKSLGFVLRKILITQTPLKPKKIT